MFIALTLGILACMGLAMARALLGSTVYDRVMAVNAFGTKTVLLIAALGFMSGRPDFMDIALVYTLINFIGTITVLKFIRYGEMSWSRNLTNVETQRDQ